MVWDGTVLDLPGRALQDLEARRIMTPLEPASTFDEDPLRMLRAVRFATTLQFSLDPSVESAIRAQAGRRQERRAPRGRGPDAVSNLVVVSDGPAGAATPPGNRQLPRMRPR